MSKLSILIVEDEAIVAEDLAGTVRQLGYAVAGITATGEEAVELARRHRPALVLMDIRLAGAMDGVAAAQQIHRECQLPVLFLTAHSDPGMIGRAQQAGALGYILKPFDERDLRIQIEMALYKHAAERRLRESDERLALAISATHIGMFDWNLASGSILWTQTHEALFGYVPASPAVTTSSTTTTKHDYRRWADRVHPEDLPLVEEASRRCLQDNKPLEVQYRIIWPDGSVHWIETKGVFLHDNGQAANRMLGIAMDITDRKQVEEQLKAINDTLERRVEERTYELQETQRQCLHAEKLSAIGKLSASIAHEFNNPLQGILSVLKGVKKRAILEEEDRELLEAAIGEGDRIKDLIRSLQDFNRPSSGKKTVMDVHKSIDSILLLQKSDFVGRQIFVVRDYAENLPEIMAVPDQVTQVFLNLLANAADACPQSGGMITLSTWQEDERVAVAIKDTGAGIKAEDMEQIYQPFFTTKPEVKGTGLGLSVSYGIIKQHQGEIRVESSPDEGTTFTVLLPIEGRATATSANDT